MPKDSMFNILDGVYNTYKKIFPNGTISQFETYVKRNFPNQVKYLSNFKNKATDYVTGTIEDLVDTSKQVQQKANQYKEAIDNTANQAKQQINKTIPKSINKAFVKEGLTSTISKPTNLPNKVANITKAAGGKFVPILATGLDAMQTVSNWNSPNTNLASRALDIAGTGLTGLSALGMASGVGFVPGAIGMLGGMGLHNAADTIRNRNNRPDLITNSIKDLTPEERKQYSQYLNNQQQQLQDQIEQTQDAINWYNAVDDRLSSNQFSSLPNIETLNMRVPASPSTNVNIPGNINRPITNLTPVNLPPVSANNNQPIIRGVTNQMNNNQFNNSQQTFNNDMANLVNNIQALSSYASGVQQGNQLPDLGISPEELKAYSNILEQYGRNVSNAKKDIDIYRNALNNTNKMQTVGTILNGLGRAMSGLFPGQTTDSMVPGFGYITGRQYQGTNLANIGQPLVDVSNQQLKNFETNLKLNQALREQQQNEAQQIANTITAARVSNLTGLPMNIVSRMEPADYMNYISPIQTAQNEIQTAALKGVSNLIQDQQQQVADYNKALALQELINQGDVNVANINQTGGYNKELLSQTGQNQRAQLDALVKTEVAKLNNDTKVLLTRMTGLNQLELERLRQQDPNAYLRAIGPVLMAATYMAGTPASQVAGDYTYNLLQGLTNQNQSQQTNKIKNYWDQFNR